MDFGKITTRQYDKQGVYHELTKNIVKGEVQSPIFCTTEERVKIHDPEEEIEEYRKFSEKVHADPDIINPVFKLETSYKSRKGGYYYVVKTYTKLEHFEEM